MKNPQLCSARKRAILQKTGKDKFMTTKRTAFFVSDHTGITAEMVGHSMLSQFEGAELEEVTLPFIDTNIKAEGAVARINSAATANGVRAIIISTLANSEIAAIVSSANALFLDCFAFFTPSLEQELGVRASQLIGRAHAANDFVNYHHRIDSINYTLSHDDGVSTRDLAEADVILVGVSRCGKTPTCLYMAMQFGIRAANYPLIPDDFADRQLPKSVRSLRNKLYGLTINPQRLHHIRNERRPGSQYATLENCKYETREAESMMRHASIPFLDATTKSVEELAATIVQEAKLQRRVY
jgi:[pyruvate, water dikinase]-phosphate phosphotransferase / [pyruvate, water dikinase] kinase